mgnify:CR=1 FL=1
MSTDWESLINDDAIKYRVIDSAVALIGDPMGSTSEAQPYMALHVKHAESGFKFDFLFAVDAEDVAMLGATFLKMTHDINDNRFLDASVYDFNEEDYLDFEEEDDDEN